MDFLILLPEKSVRWRSPPSETIRYASTRRIAPAVRANLLPPTEPEADIRANAHRLRPRADNSRHLSSPWVPGESLGLPDRPIATRLPFQVTGAMGDFERGDERQGEIDHSTPPASIYRRAARDLARGFMFEPVVEGVYECRPWIRNRFLAQLSAPRILWRRARRDRRD